LGGVTTGSEPLTLRRLAKLFGISKSAADRITGYVEPLTALRQPQHFEGDAHTC
jgi:hypothetical protein